MNLLPKICGTLGVGLTAWGFLLTSGSSLFHDGFAGLAAQALFADGDARLRWWERRLIFLLLPFFKFIGVTPTRDPYYDSKLEVRQRDDRWQDMKVLIGGAMILLGAALQMAAYWL